MWYIIDRIEGDVALCETEDRTMVEIPVALLPFAAKEGVRFHGKNDTYALIGDQAADERIRGLMDALFIRRERM